MRYLVALTVLVTLSLSLLQLTQPSRDELARQLDRETSSERRKSLRNVATSKPKKPVAPIVAAAPPRKPKIERKLGASKSLVPRKKLENRVKKELLSAKKKSSPSKLKGEESWAAEEWDSDYFSEDEGDEEWVNWGEPWPEWDDESYESH